MRNRIVAWLLVLPVVLLTACGGDGSHPGRDNPEATIARWVQTGDCSLFTDRYISGLFEPGAKGRRACQAEADRTPPERYRVQATRVQGDEAMVVAVVADGTRLTFWLVPSGERGWRIDGYEERSPGNDAIGTAEVIAKFERETGERLDRLPELSSLSSVVVGFREFIPEASGRFQALVDRFGIFSVYVADSAGEAKRIVRSLADAEGGVPGQRRKRYGNVVLFWTPGAGQTGRQFELLDAILRRTLRQAR